MMKVHHLMVAVGIAAPLLSTPDSFADQSCSPYGINSHVPDGALLQALADAGFGWVRMDFNWNGIEPSKGNFQWGPWDAAVNGAKERGLMVFATLAYSPKWAVADQGCQEGTANQCHTKPPAKVSDWTEFVTAVVQRYKGKVNHWGMWNEPNLDGFFEGTIDQYIEVILVPGSQAAKWVDPGCLVLGPELAGLTKSDQWHGKDGTCVFGNCILNGWELSLAEILDKAGSSIDIVTHHFYTDSASGLAEKILDGEYTIVKTSSSLREVIDKHGKGKEVWLTEYGWETTGYNGYEGGDTPESEQASQLVAFLLARKQIESGAYPGSDNDPWPNLKKTFSYDAIDSIVDNHLYSFGIIRTDGTKKPAWQAIKGFIAANPSACPSVAPQFKALPTVELEQGATKQNAIDLWQFVLDPDTPPGDLVFKLKSAGDPKAGIALEGGHFISVYPDTSFTGFTKGAVEVSDGPGSASAEFGVNVKPLVKKTYEAPYLSPQVDGYLTEWSGPPKVALMPPQDWIKLAADPSGASDISAQFKMAWDEGHLFIAVEVTDDKHVPNEPEDLLWLGDSVQFALDMGLDKTVGSYDDQNDWEVGVAFYGQLAVGHCFHKPKPEGMCPWEVAAVRSGNKTFYEMAFTVKGPQKKFGFTLLVNENDGAGRDGFLQWTPGMGISKSPFQFGEVTLTGTAPPPIDPGPEPPPEPIPDPVPDPVPDPGPVLDPVPETSTESPTDEPLTDLAPDTPPYDPPVADIKLDTGGSKQPKPTGGGCGQSNGQPLAEAIILVAFLSMLIASRSSSGPPGPSSASRSRPASPATPSRS